MRIPCLVVAMFLVIGIAACGTDDAGLQAENAPPASGTEGGPCYPNATCDAGLVCLSSLCVDPGASGSGGGTAGSAGDGGASGSTGGAAGAQGGMAGSAGDGGASGSTGGAAGSAGSTGGAAGASGAGGAVDMVQMPEGYWIDRTEVSRDQYAAWLATNPDMSIQDQYSCSWNLTFTPSQTCLEGQATCYLQCGKRPQSCVDWCDASAYCVAHGKRLCGQIGGGPLFSVHYAHPAYSQWYSACSSHGLYDYPYGDTYDASLCVTGWSSGGGPEPVGETLTCQAPAPYAGVFDLAGNVGEWEDSCDFPGYPSDLCHVRGGSYLFASPDRSRCDREIKERRDFADPFVGFRCCKD